MQCSVAERKENATKPSGKSHTKVFVSIIIGIIGKQTEGLGFKGDENNK